MRSLILALATACIATASAAQDLRLFSLASGNVTGGYFAAARAICHAINGSSEKGLRCSPEPTSGSLYNLDAVAGGQVEFALVQSDWHRFAYEGTDVFAESGGMPNVRSVMALYPEAVTILARRGSGIEGSADLRGKRVDIGHPSSGRHATIMRLLGALRIDRSDFSALSEFTDNAAINEICEGRIDAVVLIVGHPNSAVARALESCDVTIEPFFGPDISSVLGATTDYEKAVIPRLIYPQLEKDVPTYAVMATMITRDDVDDVLVQAVVAGVLDNLEALKAETPILSDLEPERMATEGLSAPLHDAALAMFEAQREAATGQ